MKTVVYVPSAKKINYVCGETVQNGGSVYSIYYYILPVEMQMVLGFYIIS